MVKSPATVSGGQHLAHASKQDVPFSGSLVNAYRVWPFPPTITSPMLPTWARATTVPASAAPGAGVAAGAGAGAVAAAAGPEAAAASPLINFPSAPSAYQTPPTPWPLVSPGAPSPA